jgi:hypothetical protein
MPASHDSIVEQGTGRCGGFAGGLRSRCGGFAGAATTESPQTLAKRLAPIPRVFGGFRPCLLDFAKH